MAVASIPTSAVVYREEQNFDWRVYAFVALMEALVGLTLVWLYKNDPRLTIEGSLVSMGASLFAFAAISFPVLLVVGLLRMTTEVTPSDVRVWFGWIPTYRRFIPIGEIRKIEVVSYRPLADYGGWGIRSGRDGERVLNARGNRGVRLTLGDGSRLLIGSQRPEALAVAIERSLNRGV